MKGRALPSNEPILDRIQTFMLSKYDWTQEKMKFESIKYSKTRFIKILYISTFSDLVKARDIFWKFFNGNIQKSNKVTINENTHL
jgi:hypothetical protein